MRGATKVRDMCRNLLREIGVAELYRRLEADLEEGASKSGSPRWRVNERWERQKAIQNEIARRFGEERGWRLSDRSRGFLPSVLARHGVHGGDYEEEWWERRYSDHPFYYRWPNRRAAAMVSHPYALDKDGGVDEDFVHGAKTWAASVGLNVDVSLDIKSWWYPKWTVTCIFTPASPRRIKGLPYEFIG